MKVHYINILLFAHALNTLVNNNKKPSITQHTHTNRSLCECELYARANYDSDPEMKSVMDNFNKQTQQRFQEYDERMKTTRQKCKERCDKEIQKIILKDKLEKELMDKFVTLHTDIQNDAIPTCICEKSIADKVEKGCLRCGGVLGGGVAPSVGLLGGIGICGWKMGATAEAATKYAMYDASFAAIKEGMKAAIGGLEEVPGLPALLGGNIKDLVTPKNFHCEKALVDVVQNVQKTKCVGTNANSSLFCDTLKNNGFSRVYGRVEEAGQVGAAAYEDTLATKATEFTTRNMAAVKTAYEGCQTTIIASIVAIVVIVLIMVIIYLILRYRRKKKMKKKLQYIKLLEE
ncbi:rifin PIR protein,putative [Plasmodium sp. DRC-Itaito]|nr:rifin PIR protein,putative [Plasmodium sp. DRC-Itaito]